MLKDPRALETTAYDMFSKVLEAAGEQADLGNAQGKDFRRVFGRLRLTCAAGAAADMLAELTRPERRLTLDLWSYHWGEHSQSKTGIQAGVPTDPASAARATLMKLLPRPGGALPWLTDLDRGDWREDFQPIQKCDDPIKRLCASLDSMDPRESLPSPEIIA